MHTPTKAATDMYKVVEVPATGLTPKAVAVGLEEVLNEQGDEGWRQKMIQPIIYNSSTTGYLLVVFERE